jgi:hypothetical protein
MNIDFGSLPDWITAIAAGGGALIAWWGVNAWRNELVGRDNYEIARRVLKGSYSIESIVKQIRTNWSGLFIPELIKEMSRVGADLDDAFMDARVAWGERPVELKAKMVSLMIEFRVALRTMARIDEGKVPEKRLDELYDKHANIAESDYDNDEFECRFADVVREIERYIRPHLARENRYDVFVIFQGLVPRRTPVVAQSPPATPSLPPAPPPPSVTVGR